MINKMQTQYIYIYIHMHLIYFLFLFSLLILIIGLNIILMYIGNHRGRTEPNFLHNRYFRM